MATAGPASNILVDECFSAEDERFVEEFRKIIDPKKLTHFVERWKKDPRPWARAQILKYLEHPLNAPGHQVVVKRLYKHYEAQKDHGVIGAFLVSFDTSVRRAIRKKWKWDMEARTSYHEEELYSPRNSMKGGKDRGVWKNPRTGEVGMGRIAKNPRTGAEVMVPDYPRKNAMLFTYHTRYYLRRRVWRYFRKLAHKTPDAYVPALANALVRYKDEHLERGECLLDSWSLLHACFGKHEALDFTAAGAKLREGRALGELAPAPYKKELWQKDAAFVQLLMLLQRAQARIVRVWAMQIIRAEHSKNLGSISIETLSALLSHPDDEVQNFAAEMLQNSSSLATLTIAQWMKLLETPNLTALELVCQSLAKNVTHERLDISQCVELASARTSPVARLGLNFLKQKTFSNSSDRDTLARVALTKCAAVSGDLAAFALPILATPDSYERLNVLRFFDSIHEPARSAAWEWLNSDAPKHDDTRSAAFWACLVETPYDDLQFKVFDALRKQANANGVGADPLRALWSSILLNVHRGGRYKAAAIREIGATLQRDPSQAEQLLPILAAALRSVRKPERRAALASVVTLAETHADIAARVKTYFPELTLEAVAGAAQ